jgi:hypothetical protein
MIRTVAWCTSKALWRLCRRERTSISPRVPRNVSSIGRTLAVVARLDVQIKALHRIGRNAHD